MSRLTLPGIGGSILGLSAAGLNLDGFKREMGITADDEMAKRTIKAFNDPAAAYEAYTRGREAIDQAALETFRTANTEALALGLPVETCLEYAKRRAQTERALAMELYNAAHPYASNVESLIKLAKGAPGAKTASGEPGVPKMKEEFSGSS